MGRKKMPANATDVPKIKQNVLSIRGSEEWREWVHHFCDHVRMKSASDLIDQALVEHAKRMGFNEPPPKR